MQAPGFWEDPARSKPLLQKRRALERRLDLLKRLDGEREELEAWNELLAEG
jgi:hypothetical protein